METLLIDMPSLKEPWIIYGKRPVKCDKIETLDSRFYLKRKSVLYIIYFQVS